MDYEQKYKEALGWMQSLYDGLHGATKEDAEHYFPELKESEDERIINNIKRVIVWYRGMFTEKSLMPEEYQEINAWLEKQGEKVEPIESFNSEFERQISQLIASIINKEHEYTEAFVKWTSDAFLNYAKHEIEKQGEKTPVIDFKTKDWYVSKVDGKIHNMTYDTANKTEPKFKVKYAGNEYNVLEVKDIAGVTFYGIEDEPNHIDYVKAENCEIISGYAIKENGSAYPTNPAEWSEEDEKIALSIEQVMNCASLLNIVPDKIDKIRTWLKSLKERVQLQPKWSEKDKNMLNSIIDEVMPVGECPDYPNEEERKYYYDGQEKVDWLKSLKCRYTWKPSDEQMITLRHVISGCSYDIEPLVELETKLKEL